MERCPRCKLLRLDPKSNGESQLYKSRHIICDECWLAEDAEIEEKGTNNIPETLRSYGPPNEDDINSLPIW